MARITEKQFISLFGSKSVFHFDVQGSVAKSTHAGLPWLLLNTRRLLQLSRRTCNFEGSKERTDTVTVLPKSLWEIGGGASRTTSIKDLSPFRMPSSLLQGDCVGASRQVLIEATRQLVGSSFLPLSKRPNRNAAPRSPRLPPHMPVPTEYCIPKEFLIRRCRLSTIAYSPTHTSTT